jgi:hypothetical protein
MAGLFWSRWLSATGMSVQCIGDTPRRTDGSVHRALFTDPQKTGAILISFTRSVTDLLARVRFRVGWRASVPPRTDCGSTAVRAGIRNRPRQRPTQLP